MKWPRIEQLPTMTSLPAGYSVSVLARHEVPVLMAAIERWYPDVRVGSASKYLRQSFYDSKVDFGEGLGKEYLVAAFRYGDTIVGMWAWEQEPDALSLYAHLGVFAPEHRAARLGSSVPPLSEAMGRAMGAEFLYGMATTKAPYMQQLLERAGFTLIGMTPGYDRELVSPGVVKRVYEAVYAKPLVPTAEMLIPEASNMTPKTRALFELLFTAQESIAETSDRT